MARRSKRPDPVIVPIEERILNRSVEMANKLNMLVVALARRGVEVNVRTIRFTAGGVTVDGIDVALPKAGETGA
jgi:hypothetical protein